MAEEELHRYKPLREFIDNAHHNTKACEQNKSEWFAKIDNINRAYVTLTGLLNFSEEWFIALFVLRAHSSFLAAATLSTSAQLPDSYGATRSVLENTLYGFYMWRHKESVEPWLRRQENAQKKRKVRNIFNNKKMIKELNEANEEHGKIFKNLYEATIDYGAHPNVYAILSNLERRDEKDRITFKLRYFNPDSPFLDTAMKILCQAGVLSLKVFGMIWSDRLKLTNYFQTVGVLEKGL